MKRLILLAPALLAACATPQTITKEKVERVNLPVVVGCVVGEVERTLPLKQRYPDEVWNKMSVSQKAAAVAAQAMRHQNEVVKVRAATAGCPRV